MLAAQIGRPKPGLLLLQYRNDLLFVEPAALYPIVPIRRRTLPKSGGDLGDQVTATEGTANIGPAPWWLRPCRFGAEQRFWEWQIPSPEHNMTFINDARGLR